MTNRITPFVTRLVSTYTADAQGKAATGNRLGDSPGKTWVFVWHDLNRLFAHLHELAQDHRSGFGLRDVQRAMSTARRQMEVRRQKFLAAPGNRR